MKKSIFYLILGLLVLSGCATSRCVEPTIESPNHFSGQMHSDSLSFADLSWMEIIGDSLLVNLIETALEYNKNLLVAGERIEEFERLYRVQRSGFFPTVGLEAYADRETNNRGGENYVEDIEVAAKMTLSWEADLFGRLRWASREAKAQYMQRIEARRAVQMTLIADVATAYFELVALDRELQIVRSTIAIRQENVNQARLRFEGGLISEIPYQQAQVELAKTASMLPDLRTKIKMKENEISFLTGAMPSVIRRATIDSDIITDESLHIGLPSDLLKRRPDVREAEYALQEAMANVGYSWADRFPRLTIGLDGGFENSEFGGLLRSPLTYMVSELTSPVFSFGKKRAQYQAALEAYDAERLRYEECVLQAFREADNAVVSYRSARENTALMEALKASSHKYVELARFQYLNGQIDYLDVLDAQRSYFNAEIDFSNAIRDQYLALIQLYKALGGGWHTTPEPADTAEPALADHAEPANTAEPVVVPASVE